MQAYTHSECYELKVGFTQHGNNAARGDAAIVSIKDSAE